MLDPGSDSNESGSETMAKSNWTKQKTINKPNKWWWGRGGGQTVKT